MTIEELPTIREIIRQFGLTPKKSLGQNYILDLNITQKIARAAGDLTNCTVIEIGPGPGALTRALLLEGAEQIIAIEKDSSSCQALTSLVEAANGKLQVLNADALQLDYARIALPPKKVVANLPYNISTQLLMHWLDQPAGLFSLTLMFQKEVAERLTAQPGTSSYGRLSVLTQFCGEAKIAFVLPPSVFYPPPAVYSAVVHLTFHPSQPFPCSWQSLKHVTRYAFAQRRKMLRSTLKPAFKNVEQLLQSLGIEPTLRAENLTLTQFCQLAKAYEETTASCE